MQRNNFFLLILCAILVTILIVIYNQFRKKNHSVEMFRSSLLDGKRNVGRFLINFNGRGSASDSVRLHYFTVDGVSVFQGDIILGIKRKTGSRFMQMQAFFTSKQVWQGGIVPYDFDDDIVDSDTTIIIRAMQEWESKTKVKFVRHIGQANFVRFTYNEGYASPIGPVGNQQPLYFPRDPDKGNLMHELGHCLGLWHEHCRPDRGNYIRIIETNIKEGFLCQFIQPISGVTTLNTKYDLNSIMHYPVDAFAKPGLHSIEIINDNGNYNVGNRDSLSTGDINGVKLLYNVMRPISSDQNTIQTQINCSDN